MDGSGESEPEEDPPVENALTEWPHPPSPPPPPSPPSSPPGTEGFDDDDDNGAVTMPTPNGECIGCGLRSAAGQGCEDCGAPVEPDDSSYHYNFGWVDGPRPPYAWPDALDLPPPPPPPPSTAGASSSADPIAPLAGNLSADSQPHAALDAALDALEAALDEADVAPPPAAPLPRCPACGIFAHLCPFHTGGPSICTVCQRPVESGDIWCGPPMHIPYRQHWRPIQDGNDTILPLTWERVRSSHEWLAAHAACPGAPGIPPAPPPQARPAGGGYTSEDDIEPCFCTQDAAVWTHFRNVCKESCVRWPGPICGSCWAASCECGYVFDDVADAAGRWFTGRMRCHECTASGPGWDGWHGWHTAW